MDIIDSKLDPTLMNRLRFIRKTIDDHTTPDEDLVKTAMAMLRLQEVYNISARNLTTGNLRKLIAFSEQENWNEVASQSARVHPIFFSVCAKITSP